MGMFDMAKMAQKAMAAKAKMSKMTAAGQKRSTAMLINGLYEILKIEIDATGVRNALGGLNSVSDEDLAVIIREIEKDVIDASKDARQNLEKEMSANTSIDDLKDILQD